ncbi:MAG: class I SAM-dependent methyltransferase [Actinomycetota bacterium]|nr:class I SAM-dependent methyltransferase [Actinomycetota bacterium]
MDERHWGEEDSAVYRRMGAVAVPARAEQIAVVVALLPFGRDDAFRVVDLGSGEGALSAAILACYRRSSVSALDGSESMREQTQARLGRFGRRAEVRPFRLEDLDGEAGWLDATEGAGGVVSSLCIHHLDDAGKKRLFEEVGLRLGPGGALLMADVVEPVRPEAAEVYAATWDRATEEQALALDGSAGRFGDFVEQRWNLYRYPDPEIDKPSPVADQLRWLREAGFETVDCFWLRAGHAVLGGYKPGSARSGAPVGFEEALACAQAELEEPGA